MDQLKKLWTNLTPSQRIWLAVAVVAVIGGLSALAHWNEERGFKPLFTGLAAEDAGALLAKLHETGVDYRLADGGATILVPEDKVAETRIQLAAAGLPKSGRIGFELFDKTNFGASDFAEQVNYHRAIEGELERSVMAIREVEEARVHITMAKDSLYSESREPAKASVLVKLRPGGHMDPANVAAICQLTASAVPGLSPEAVSVVDTDGRLLNRPRRTGTGDQGEPSEAALDYRKTVEHDLQTKIAQTLEPLIGADHFRIGVSADVDLTSGEQSAEVFDPQKSVMVSSQKTEDGPALPAASGVPGTPSNVPHPTAKPSTGSSNYARRTESINYQSSRTVTHTKLPEGAVKRLSLSVLVDHTLRWQGTGDKAKKIIEPPSAEKLKVIKDLVTAAAGLDTTRGDQLVVEAFPFESTLMAQPDLPAAESALPRSTLPPWLANLLAQKNFLLIAAIGSAAMLTLGIGAFVVIRKRGRKRPVHVETGKALSGGGQNKAIGPSPADGQKEVEARMQARLAEQAVEKSRKDAETLMNLKLPDVATKKTEVLTKHISAEAKKDPTAMAHVVRSWLNGEEIQR